MVVGKNLTAKEKQKLRNRISALKSRMAKKLELTQLETNRNENKTRFNIILRQIYVQLREDQIEKLLAANGNSRPKANEGLKKERERDFFKKQLKDFVFQRK